MPICFLDQYFDSESGTCEQCPLGYYSLAYASSSCIPCRDLTYGTDILTDEAYARLAYYCRYKFGQISSLNDGEYDPAAYPLSDTLQDSVTEDGEDEILVIVEEETVTEVIEEIEDQ